LSIAFTLDDRARWHDGTPVSSADVRLSFQLYTHPDVESKNAPLLGNIDSVSAPDARTATFWFKRRSPQQFYDAAHHLFVMPSHLLRDVPPSQLATAPLARVPVGTGRFRFVQWVSGQRVEIVADTANYRGRPNLDRVIYVPTADFSAAMIALFSGQIDFFSPLRPESIEQATTTPGVSVHMYPARTYQHVAFNVRNPAALARPHPVLGDRAVRRALSLATNRERIVQTVFDSIGRVAIGPAVRVSLPGYEQLQTLGYDVDAARALLDSAGWTMRAGDSVRAKNRVPLRVEVLVPSVSASRDQMATLLQDQLRVIGVDVVVRRLEVNALIERIESGRFDAYMGAVATSPGNVGLRQTWGPAGTGVKGLNHSGYNSPVFNAYVDTALTTFDLATAQRTMLRAMQTIIDDAPAIWMLEESAPAGVHARMDLGSMSALGWWHGLPEWRIAPSKRIDRDRVGLVSAN
jgi:peptide/nickel transport system substrate-binding protein